MPVFVAIMGQYATFATITDSDQVCYPSVSWLAAFKVFCPQRSLYFKICHQTNSSSSKSNTICIFEIHSLFFVHITKFQRFLQLPSVGVNVLRFRFIKISDLILLTKLNFVIYASRFLSLCSVTASASCDTAFRPV